MLTQQNLEQTPRWIDTHVHLDAPEFDAVAHEIRALAAINNVAKCVYPAVHTNNFAEVQQLAHALGDSYALGIHPLYVNVAQEADLATLDSALSQYADDPRLVAVGEIGLDFFAPGLNQSPLKEKQIYFYEAQLKLARKHGLPVILHVRRSADDLLKGLRKHALAPNKTTENIATNPANTSNTQHKSQGIAHAFNGSDQQAAQFIALGFKLGFGGAMTYERAQQLRHLAATLPLEALVLETDAPDMPPHWLYKTAEQRAAGEPQGRNDPSHLPRIAQELARLRGIDLYTLAQACWENSLAALPKLKTLV